MPTGGHTHRRRGPSAMINHRWRSGYCYSIRAKIVSVSFFSSSHPVPHQARDHHSRPRSQHNGAESNTSHNLFKLLRELLSPANIRGAPVSREKKPMRNITLFFIYQNVCWLHFCWRATLILAGCTVAPKNWH